MRAAMKLATCVAPVALGVALTLVSGQAKAEEKAAQSLTGAVSALTTLPSVGHRPIITSANVFTDKLFSENIASSSATLSKGDQIFIRVNTVTDIDKDSLEPIFYCNVYGVDSNDTDSLIAENISCSAGPDGSIPVTIDDSLHNKRVAVDIYAQSDATAAQMNGYTPVPLKSTAYRVISANTIVDKKPIPFLRPAYAEVNGKRIEVDRGDPNDAHDDVIHLPSAFAGAKMNVFIEGGRPTYKVDTTGNNSFSTVINNYDTHSAEITIKNSLTNSNDGELLFSVIDGGGRPGGQIINFRIKIKEVFISRTYKKNWSDAKADCESDSYVFPYLGQGKGENGDPGYAAPGSLSNSTLFWGGYSKYSFPNASENHWTRSEIQGPDGVSRKGLTFSLDQPNSVTPGDDDMDTLLYFMCKKVF